MSESFAKMRITLTAIDGTLSSFWDFIFPNNIKDDQNRRLRRALERKEEEVETNERTQKLNYQFKQACAENMAKDRAIAEKDRAIAEKDRKIAELKQHLNRAVVDRDRDIDDLAAELTAVKDSFENKKHSQQPNLDRE